MKFVSLFSGCLGLDLGLEAAGIETVCAVEIDPDALRLIRDRRPDVRIVDDVRSVDASLLDELGEIDGVAGGFPCQDLSYAGRGAGLDGDRSGLWFEMIRVVRELRPRLVLVENVPGLLTRGLHVVVHDLARAGYVGRWFTVGAVDVGAPHRRERVFILASRAAPVGLDDGHPSGNFDASGWLAPQETLFGAEPLLRLGKRGRWTPEAVYEDDARLAIDDDSDETLLPTPNAYESTPTGDFVDEMREAGVDPEARPLLPTPVANPDNPGAGGELRAALEHGPGRRNETGIDSLGRPNRGRPSKLLPTPQKSDGDGGRVDRNPETLSTGRRPSGSKASVPLATAVDQGTDVLLPTPKAQVHRASRRAMVDERQWASPQLEQAAEMASGELPREFDSWDEVPGSSASMRPERPQEGEIRWGVYEPAVRRWEALFRPAPAPTDEKGRLSPEFVTWMMGFPAGWTDVEGIARTAKLRLLGNAVHVFVGYRVALALLSLDRQLSTSRA